MVEDFFAVSVERRITHPCVAAITQAARGGFFPGLSGSSTAAERSTRAG
jgi:LysR family transcriptional regulator, transcriptional activator of nhaA